MKKSTTCCAIHSCCALNISSICKFILLLPGLYSAIFKGCKFQGWDVKFRVSPRCSPAFSIVELMTIVTIISILAALTLPTYLINTTQAKLTNVVSVLNGLSNIVIVAYNANTRMPNALYGVDGTGAGGYGPYVVNNVTNFLHYVNGSTWNRRDAALIQVTITPAMGGSVPGYVESTNGSDGAYNTIAMAFYEYNFTMVVYCGRWDSSNTIYVPPDYLPPGCSNDNFMTDVIG